MNDLVPNNFFLNPYFRIPSLWSEEDDWLTTSSSNSGLSISEDDKNIYIEAALPGIESKNIEVTFHEGYLWIRGEESEEEKDKNKKYHRQATKSFSYRVAIPGEIDQNVDPEANYKNGVMKVTFAKSPKLQPKKIQVKTSTEK